MKKFEYLEQAITTLKKFSTGNNWASTISRKISLARFDYTPVNSLSKQVEKGLAFTDRQRDFVSDLVYKYRKQWRKVGWDVEQVCEEKPTFRPIRKIIRESWVGIEDNHLVVRFLYDPDILTYMNKFADMKSAGLTYYDKEANLWRSVITEENIEMIRSLANKYDFSITPDFQERADALVPFSDYKIELVRDDDGLSITNAPPSMLEWIAENVGELSMENFDRLCSLSSILSFTLSDSIQETLRQTYAGFYPVVTNQLSHLSPSEVSFDEVVKYIKVTKPKSVVVYVPDRIVNELDIHESISKQFGAKIIDKPNNFTYTDGSTKIHFCRTKIDVIPELMISFSGFMFGPSRKSWLNSSGKVIYFCNELQTGLIKKVYNLK